MSFVSIEEAGSQTQLAFLAWAIITGLIPALTNPLDDSTLWYVGGTWRFRVDTSALCSESLDRRVRHWMIWYCAKFILCVYTVNLWCIKKIKKKFIRQECYTSDVIILSCVHIYNNQIAGCSEDNTWAASGVGELSNWLEEIVFLHLDGVSWEPLLSPVFPDSNMKYSGTIGTQDFVHYSEVSCHEVTRPPK